MVEMGIFTPCAKYVLHPGVTGTISGYFGSIQGGPTSPWFRVLGFEKVRASLGDLVEEPVVVVLRKLAVGLHLGAEQPP